MLPCGGSTNSGTRTSLILCAIVLGPPATLQLLLVGGSVAVEAGEMRTADSESLARHARASARELGRRAGVS